MRSAVRWIAVVALVGAAFGVGTVVSQDQGAGGLEAYRKEWKRLATPGEGHKKLDVFTGVWTASTPTVPEAGLFAARWMLGGRFMMLAAKSDEEAGPTARAFAILGYDNAFEKYVMVNTSNGQTFISYMIGTADADGKVFTFGTEMLDPVLKCKIKVRSVITVASKDEFHWETWVDYLNGKPELKTLDSTFKRKE